MARSDSDPCLSWPRDHDRYSISARFASSGFLSGLVHFVLPVVSDLQLHCMRHGSACRMIPWMPMNQPTNQRRDITLLASSTCMRLLFLFRCREKPAGRARSLALQQMFSRVAHGGAYIRQGPPPFCKCVHASRSSILDYIFVPPQKRIVFLFLSSFAIC